MRRRRWIEVVQLPLSASDRGRESASRFWEIHRCGLAYGTRRSVRAPVFYGAQGGAYGPSLSRLLEGALGSRDRVAVARIQFALAGINAHINHDLPQAIANTCQVTATAPQHGTAHYNDYTALNSTLDSMVELAKKSLHVRLLGDPLPPVSRLEDTIAAWSVLSAREAAWQNSELLWHLRSMPPLSSNFMNGLDGLTTVAGKTLLVPVP